MYLIVSRDKDNAMVRIHFPATLEEIQHDLSQLDGPVQIVGTSSYADRLEHYIRSVDLNSGANIEKLNQLAERVNGMDEWDERVFSAVLDAERTSGLDDALRIASSLSQYELIQDITSDKELGGWLVEHGLAGVDFPEQVRPYLDYAGIGEEYYAAHGGAYTAHGYVKRRENVPVLEETEKSTIRLTFGTSKGEHCLALPASDEKLAQTKEALGVDEFAQASISAVQYFPADLAELIPLDAISVEEANELALWLRQMEQEDSGLMKYRAVLEVEQPDTFSQAVTIAMDIEDYELVPENMDEYGKQVLRRIGADDELLDTIDGYMNFTQLGQDSLAEDGVRSTEFGLVRRLSAPFPSQEEMGPMMC